MGFPSTLFRHPGAGGWTFAPIPEEHAPPATEPWGRTPVTAVVDGVRWETSVWRDRAHGTLVMSGNSDGFFPETLTAG